MKIALVGNQNSGKTTLFNLLTGTNQKVGNWPGVTIERKEGIIKGLNETIVDLPGIYSLSPYTSEEEVSRMGLEKVAVNIDWTVGDLVQIVSGPLESFSGKVISLNDSTQKAMVNVEMFGRNTDVEVDFVQIKKISASAE